MPVFPARKFARLTYHETNLSLTGGSAAGTYVFSASGLFDPDITSTGHQPIGFDQMMLFYNHYVVLAAKITLQAFNMSEEPLSISISRNADTTGTSNPSRLIENGNVVFTTLAKYSSATCFDKLILSMDIQKYGGVDNVIDNSVYRGTNASNPQEQSFFHINVWNSVSLTNVTAKFHVTIEYEAVFMEPRPLPQS